MAKVKVINSNLDLNLNGVYFNDFPSKTIFSFGRFQVTSNFDNKQTIDYSNTLSTFVREVTLETMGVSEVQSQILHTYSNNAVLNLDRSDLNTFVRFGSAYEFLRVSIQNIILAYPGSLFANSRIIMGGVSTYLGNSYNSVTNVSTFYVPIACTVNTFGLVFNDGNISIPDNQELKNLNLSYAKYVISTSLEPDKQYKIIGFTGNTKNNTLNYIGTTFPVEQYLKIQTIGNPFLLMGSGSSGNLNFHIKPNNIIFEEFRALLNPYETNLVSQRLGVKGFQFMLKTPTLLDDGEIIYSDTQVLWATTDDYNIDINTSEYQTLLQIVLTIGAKYDKIKTDLIARFLTPMSLKTYDYTQEGKISKLLRIYGREFDQIREFIDSLVYINKVTYDKINNIPDQLIKNMSRTFGWDYFSLVNEEELVQSFLTVSDAERNLNEDILPAEIDVELWRRILNNTSYFWKSKGTRESIKSMFLLIGIPEPFINITEYVYTVEGKIDPNTVQISQQDFPTNSLPYDNSGYPVAPLERNDFYFQISGNTDGGQRYLDVFRMAGFNITPTIDNKKSWVQTGATTRVHNTTPQYSQEDSKLVINTKEVDIALDTARGIEYDIYKYIQEDFKANSSGYTLPYSYVNVSLAVSASQNTFPLPSTYSQSGVNGDLEVRFNGILLNAPKSGTTTGISYQSDYSIDEVTKTFTILNNNFAHNDGYQRDVIHATFVYSGGTHAISGISVQYVVTRVNANPSGAYVLLPSMPSGDIQVTINGIALTKGTSQFNADYILDPANTSGSSQIIIQNPEVIQYLIMNPMVQISYIEVLGTNDINLRSEIERIDSFNTNKIYFSNAANKYVYKLNYKANNASEIKFLVDGIALEPYRDYDINVMNPYEVYLPKGLRYGTVLSVYYLVGGNTVFSPVIADEFGIGDISKLSFLEFLELAQRKMINARNRKTISDFKGGWYPTLFRIYEMYLQRSLLLTGDTLHSNGYTFQNLYPFLNKYNAFFQRFVDQLLSATIIIKKGGLLVRNTIFTKQKFVYKRGVNVGGIIYGISPAPNDNENVSVGNLNNRDSFQYFGDDGSVFMIAQNPKLFVETNAGTAGTGELINIGGKNIMGSGFITSYGVQYRESGSLTWIEQIVSTPLFTNDYVMTVFGLLDNTLYEYRAIVRSDMFGATGNTLSLTTQAIVIPIPSGLTTQNTSSTTTSLVGTGGHAIQRYAAIGWYGMQYSAVTTSSPTAFNVSPLLFDNIPNTEITKNLSIIGETTNSYTVSAGMNTWLIPQSPQIPIPAGISSTVLVCTNTSTSSRIGCVCYTPNIGNIKCVEFQQLGAEIPPPPPTNSIYVGNIVTSDDFTNQSGQLLTLNPMTEGQYYYVSLSWTTSKTACLNPSSFNDVCVVCNGTTLHACHVQTKTEKNCNGNWSNIYVGKNDTISIVASAEYPTTKSIISLNSVTNGSGLFNIATGSCKRVYASCIVIVDDN